MLCIILLFVALTYVYLVIQMYISHIVPVLFCCKPAYNLVSLHDFFVYVLYASLVMFHILVKIVQFDSILNQNQPYFLKVCPELYK